MEQKNKKERLNKAVRIGSYVLTTAGFVLLYLAGTDLPTKEVSYTMFDFGFPTYVTGIMAFIFTERAKEKQK